MKTMDEEGKDALDTEEETEETSPEDKTSEEENEDSKDGAGKDGKEKKGNKRSEIFQKRKYRERALNAEHSVEELRTELASLKEMIKKPTDEAERKAQEYIRKQAREVYDELQKVQKDEETKAEKELDARLADILDVNPDVTEEELLDIMEEYEVEPETALKIFKKQSENPAKPKPKMPQAKRGAGGGGEEKKKPDDSKKSLWQIAQEEARKIIKE